MKILYVTTIGATMSFFVSFIGELLRAGHTVDIATNENDRAVPQFYRDNRCRVFHIDTSRSPFSYGNIKAIRQIKMIAEKGRYDIIHCHTPLAAMCTRIACIGARNKGTKVIYTAHGFHFYKGAPLKNWLIYFPVEWLCSFFTDVLITINKEDYRLAKLHMHAKKVVYVPGVGVDTTKFKYGNRQKIRNELGISDNEIMLLSVGELNENKNHITVINALSKLKNPPVYVIVGQGDLADNLKSKAHRLGVRVILTGYRKDVVDMYAAADIYILPSLREGLNVSLMEAMASGLPCIAGRIRGNVDLIRNGVNGYLCKPDDADAFAKRIRQLCNDNDKRSRCGMANARIVHKYSIYIINNLMKEIYIGIFHE